MLGLSSAVYLCPLLTWPLSPGL